MGEGLEGVLPFPIVAENDFTVQEMDHQEFLVEYAHLSKLCGLARLDHETNHRDGNKQ
jgi:hypothetical protein